MSNRSLAILTALVVLLGAFIWFFERHQPTSEEASKLAKELFPGIAAEEIRGLEVTNRHGAFLFTKIDGDWRLTAPIAGPADEVAIDGAVGSLLGLEIKRALDSAEVEGDAYGLAEPDMSIALITENGDRLGLAIGGTTPLGGDRAVSRKDGKIILTSGAFTTGLDKTLDDWRSRDLVKARLADLTSIEILTRGDRIEAVQEDGEWRLRSPFADLADRDLLQTFLSDITGVRIEDFLDGPDDLEALGINQPRHRIMLVRADGGENTILDFGDTREVDGATQVLCLRNGVDFFWVNDRAETVLGKAPVKWREPHVRHFETWDVDDLVFSAGETSASLSRTGGSWTFENGEAADSAEVQKRLSALAELEVADFDLMDLGTPEIARVAIGRTGADAKDLVFVFQAPLGDGGNILVQVTGRETLMSVRPEDAELIFENLEALHPVAAEEINNAEAPEDAA